MARWVAICGAAWLLVAACASDDVASDPVVADAGNDVTGPAFGDSACYACSSAPCAAEIATCTSDPSCAERLACLKRCPPGTNADVDAACDQACPPPTGSVAVDAWNSFAACRDGSAATCADCGGSADAASDVQNVGAVLDQQCAASTLTDVCDACLFESCCDSMTEVSVPGPVKSVFDCWYDCNANIACETECFAKYPDGVVGFSVWGACISLRCIGEGKCPSQQPCGLCTYQNCKTEFAACALDKECFLARSCSAGCGTNLDCAAACLAANPGGQQEFDTLGVCITQHCTSVCGG